MDTIGNSAWFQGYNAYNSKDCGDWICPYPDDRVYGSRRKEWILGWREAEYDKEMREQEQERKRVFDSFACLCPWKNNEYCSATYDAETNEYQRCERENCALVYLHENWRGEE